MSAPKSYHLLTTADSYVVLTMDTRPSALVFLTECIPDAQVVTAATHPNYTDAFFLTLIPPEEFPLWSWNKKRRVLTKTPAATLTEELRTCSRFATKKLEVIHTIMRQLGRARIKAGTSVDMQDIVYLQKQTEAQRFKDSGYNEDDIIEYPYILQYADHAQISPKEAADAILFKARLHTDLLVKTEALRLKYFNGVKAAQNEDDLSALAEAFRRAMYVNVQVQ